MRISNPTASPVLAHSRAHSRRPGFCARVRQRVADQSGQVAPLMMVFLTLFMLAGVLVIDIGLMLNERRQAQTAADFAALAAAQDLPYNADDPLAATKMASARSTAEDYLRANGYDPTESGVTSAVTTSYLGSVDKISVEAGREFHWLFGDFFGVAPGVTVSAHAAAQTNSQPRDVMVVLDRSGSMCLYTHGGPMLTCPNPPGDPDHNHVNDWQPFDQMRTAAKNFASYFTPTYSGVTVDRLGLVTFSDGAVTNLGLTTNYVGPTSAYATAINSMVPAGTTNIGYAIAKARQELQANGRPEAVKVIVLLSDGSANIYRTGGPDSNPTFGYCFNPAGCSAGDNYTLTEAHNAVNAGEGIYTIGITAAAGTTLLQNVANVGASGAGGQFFYVTNMADLDSTFRRIADLVRVALLE